MHLEQYEDLETYREEHGWKFSRAVDHKNNQFVHIRRYERHASVSPETVQDYLNCLERIRSHPHPNLLAVHEAGVANEQLVVISEWSEAVDWYERTAGGISLDEVVSTMVAMASTLQHLNAHGIVYRTVHPQHILFEATTQKVRLDVPLWHLTSPTSFSEFDQDYVAPEVHLSNQFSVASDLYAFGIVLYATLMGNFPWTDQNSVPRPRMEEDVVPRLPPSLAPLQQLFDEILCFDPTSRILTTERLLAVSTEVSEGSALDRGRRFRSGTIQADEVKRVVPPLDQGSGTISENPAGRSRFWLWGTVSTLVMVGVVAFMFAYTNFDSVRMVLYEIGFADHPELSARWRQAESLRLDQNQNLITLITAYNQVLELDPTHGGAHRAIADVKDEHRARIERHIEADEYSQAQSRLDEFVTAVPNDEEIVALVSALGERQTRDTLLADARPWVAAGIEDLVSLDNAVRVYQTVLSIFEESEEARRQLNDIAIMYVEAAIDAAKKSDIERAEFFFEKAEKADPKEQRLEEAREDIDLATRSKTLLNTTIQEAQSLEELGQLITPVGDDNAMSKYRQVLDLDPGNELAVAKLKEIEQQLLSLHQELLEERQFGAEVNFRSAAREAGVSDGTLQSMISSLESLQQKIASASQLYRQALALYHKGYVSAPLEDNAISVLRRAHRLDPKNVDIEELLNQCAERTAEVAQQAFLAGLTDEAKTYLAIAIDIQPLNDNWVAQLQEWNKIE